LRTARLRRGGNPRRAPRDVDPVVRDPGDRVVCGPDDRRPPLQLRMKNRLRVLRAERDWSQADLAERLGVSRQTVNAIETERYDPSLPLAFSLARTFKRQIEEIFEAERSRL